MLKYIKMPQRKIAVIAGASGLIGSRLLEQLLGSPEYTRVISIGRRQLPLKNEKLEQLISDFSDLKKYDIWTETSVVFCCIGTTMKKAGSKEAFRRVDYEIPVRLAEAASLADAQFHLVSSIGASVTTSNFYLHTKGETEAFLRSAGLRSVHIYRPSLLLGKRAEFRFGEKLGTWLYGAFSWLMLGPLRKYKGIQADKVAAAMLHFSLAKTEEGVFIHENNELLDLS